MTNNNIVEKTPLLSKANRVIARFMLTKNRFLYLF